MGNFIDEVCIGCNENAVTMTELYCTNCYLELNSETDYDSLNQLWTTKENA